MSIRKKMNLVLLVIGIVTSFCITAFNYYEEREKIFKEAYKKSELISSFAMASREYTKKTMRPLAVKLAGKESFHPELMAGFYVVRAIADIFAESQDGFYFKQATLNPILPQNKSDHQETEIIEFFKKNRDKQLKKGMLTKQGEDFFFVARPVVNKKNCNRCHGLKADAPKEQIARYPGTGGYNWEIDDVVATLITYVPINKALEELKITAIKSILVWIAAIAVLMFSTSYAMNKIVVKPVVILTELAGNMSRGKDLDKPIVNNSKDEIGALYVSFNRMRKSVIKLVQIIKEKKA